MYIKRYLPALFICLLAGCSAKKHIANAHSQVIDEQTPVSDKYTFSLGMPAYHAAEVVDKLNGKTRFSINFHEPVVVGVADKPYDWGYFQFPDIGREPDGKLLIKWAMQRDAMESYGSHSGGSAVSADGGKSWQEQQHAATVGGILLPNGDRIAIATPKPVPVEGLKLPKPVGSSSENYRKSDFTFYRMRDLPVSCQGVYLNRLKKGDTEWKIEQDSLYDPNAIRYTLSGKIPVVWWGDVHVAADGSAIAGIYPGNWVRNDGTFDDKNNIFFYRTTDSGHSWHMQGRLMHQPDLSNDPQADKRMGLLEPGYTILKDGTFVCIMRTTDGAGMGPMYASYSKDMGKSWSKIKVMSANGVLPRVLQLNNGVIVLASGRPGVQLRFASAADPQTWSKPFEMLPYNNPTETVSCGYTGLIATGKNSFMIVYSDFNYKTADGNIRKAIKVREVTVN